MVLKLRDLIRQVRAAKTAQEEREVVQKECAAIREGFRKEDADNRGKHMAKLLYIHMLGYPAHFGQLECLKLVTSNRFGDKRIGHLGSMMLLDELKDVHMLITNSLKNDLGHQLQYVSGLALCTLGSILSVDMARDLCSEVEKLLKSSNSFIRKKAVLCAVRILRRVPDLLDNFVPATRSLLGDRNHGVLITGVTLITEMCAISPENLGHFRRLVPTLVRVLKNLIMSASSQEHDVNGVTDPFLQCKIIRLLRVLCKDDMESAESVNDILAQVATNTDTTKTVGNAILYETVMCILEIHAESGLRVLAINSLGKFLSNPDRNIRYVGLSTLLSTVGTSQDNSDAMQRHRSTIIDCLQEPDVTIRRRSLQLIFALINEKNIENLVKELLDFITIADDEFKPYIASEIINVSDKYAPNGRWHVDTVLSVLHEGGAHIAEHTIPNIVQLLTQSEHASLQPYIVQRCYQMLQEKFHHSATCQVGVWCIGEMGDLLCGPSVLQPPQPQVNAEQVLDLLYKVLVSPATSQSSKTIALTSTMKLSSRLTGVDGRIRTMVGSFADNVDMEMQQRSVEYTSIFNAYNAMRPALLERMPAQERKSERVASGDAGQAPAPSIPTTTAPAPSGGGNDLLDLLGDSGSAPLTQQPPVPAMGGGLMDLLGGLDMSAPVTQQPPMPAMGGGLMDLLGGLDMSAPVTQQPPMPAMGGGLMDLLGGGAPATAVAPQNTMDLLGGLDLMGGGPIATPAPVAVATPAGGIPSITAWEKNGLVVKFDFNKNPQQPNVLQILLTATNSTQAPMGNFLFQIAVPTNMQLQLQAQSSSVIPPMNGGSVTQRILLNNPQHVAIRMRTKISYQGGMGPVDEMGEVSNFPPNAL